MLLGFVLKNQLGLFDTLEYILWLKVSSFSKILLLVVLRDRESLFDGDDVEVGLSVEVKQLLGVELDFVVGAAVDYFVDAFVGWDHYK